MLKKYKNELYHLVSRGNFNLSDFSIKEAKENKSSQQQLKYKESKMILTIEESEDSFHNFRIWYTKFEKGYPKVGPSPQKGHTNFASIKNIINSWLNNELKKFILEIEEVDFWSQLSNNKDSFKLEYINFNDSSQFTNDEKEQVKLSLKEAAILIQENILLSKGQFKILEERISYLISTLDRIDKKVDWKTLAIGSFISMILNMGVDTDTGKLIWEILKKVFSNVPALPI